jgi:capsular polysaccharide biosynthesis protein|tara:strand:- start:286 stop:435 length:150 start_codon:yes stop_codon:yes gene_type:complete
MKKIIEKNLALIIILTVLVLAFSSCGSIRMGDYHAWERTYGPKNCSNNW